MEITFTIPDEKLERITTAIKAMNPIPETDGTPDFTDNQWAKESLRRHVIQQVHAYELALAKSSIDVQKDDTLVI